jgi:SAM-dependent methyltransferase
MTSELWALYMRLQTEIAYPPWTLAFQKSEKAIGEAQEFYAWLVTQTKLSSPRTLLIGPGGINEIEALKRATNDAPFDVLTAHASEAAVYRGYRVITADMHDMPILNATYDLVYASNVLEHAFSPYIALMEIRRVLKPGARAYFILPSFAGVEGGIGPFHLHCLTREVWEELLKKTGYTLIETKIYPPEGAGVTSGHYLCFLVQATPPPYPHSEIFNRLVEHKSYQL